MAAAGVLVATLVVLGIALRLDPPAERVQLLLALVFLTITEVAWYTGWIIDRQIELARKISYRVAPARTLRASFAIILTIAVTLVLAVRT